MIKIFIILAVSVLLAVLHIWVDTKIKKRTKGDSDD